MLSSAYSERPGTRSKSKWLMRKVREARMLALPAIAEMIVVDRAECISTQLKFNVIWPARPGNPDQGTECIFMFLLSVLTIELV